MTGMEHETKDYDALRGVKPIRLDSEISLDASKQPHDQPSSRVGRVLRLFCVVVVLFLLTAAIVGCIGAIVYGKYHEREGRLEAQRLHDKERAQFTATPAAAPSPFGHNFATLTDLERLHGRPISDFRAIRILSFHLPSNDPILRGVQSISRSGNTYTMEFTEGGKLTWTKNRYIFFDSKGEAVLLPYPRPTLKTASSGARTSPLRAGTSP